MVQKPLPGSLIDVLNSIISHSPAEYVRLLLFFIGLLIAVVLLPAGCTHFQPVLTLEEPSLRSLAASNRMQQADIAGQQNASIELTDQGLSYLSEWQLNEAISLFEKAIALHPSNPYAYYYLAKARYIRKEYPQTLPLLGKAELYLKGDSTWLSWIYALRGKTYEALSRLDEARHQYQQSLSKDSRNAEARDGIDRLTNLSY
jgi:tetratricopeptide (TPR) repeat protein